MADDAAAGGLFRGPCGDGARRRVGGVGGPVVAWLTNRRGCRVCVAVATFAIVWAASHAVW